MKNKKRYNEDVNCDEGFAKGDGYPSCDGEPCVNVADDGGDVTDTMADSMTSDKSAEATEWREKFLRLQAEFDNYRKRTLKEKMDLVQTGGSDVLKAILPICDDVQRAVDAMRKSDDIEALRAGVDLIEHKFVETLRQKSVVKMEIKGEPFDADHQEAVAKFAAGEQMKDRVVDVIQEGYMLGDKVLRFAKVVVGE